MNSDSFSGEQMSFIEPRENKPSYLFESGIQIHLARGGKGELINSIYAIRLDGEIHDLTAWQATSASTIMSGDSELEVAVNARFGARVNDARKVK